MKNLTILILSFCLLSFYACDNNILDEKIEEELNEADILVNSPEFEAYDQVLKTDRRMMRKILRKLPSSQKELYFETLLNLTKASDIESFDSICQRLTNIIGVDFVGRINRILTAKADVLMDKNIPSIEILKAIQRKNVSSSRSFNSVEDEIAYSKCTYECERSYNYNINKCGNHDWWTDIDYRVCIADMMDIRDACLYDCDMQYL